MAEDVVPVEPQTEFARVVQWRRERFEEAGFPEEEAFLLAQRADIDLHDTLELLARGCDWKTALKILI